MMNCLLSFKIKPMNQIMLYFMQHAHKKRITDNHKPSWNNSAKPSYRYNDNCQDRQCE